MKKDTSYGIIPLRYEEEKWQVLLICHQAGHWAFSKGHAEPGESPQQAAERELKEETGLLIQRYLTLDPLKETYFFTFQGQLIAKTVYYFLALVGGAVVLQESEVQASQWLSLPDAYSCITFKEGKRMCMQVQEILKDLSTK